MTGSRSPPVIAVHVPIDALLTEAMIVCNANARAA
jgi:hypothetical protein